MLYINFDQASNDTGYSIFEDTELVEFGKFKTESHDFFDKVIETQEFVYEIINKFSNNGKRKDVKIGFEDIQFQNFAGKGGNVLTFKRLAQLQGVLIVSVKRNFEQYEIQTALASQWKSFSNIKGKNRTEQKRNAQKYVLDNYGKEVTQDEADAILLGKYFAGQELNWG